MGPVSILLVDDSPSSRLWLEHLLRTDPEVRLAGTACGGEEAVALVARRRPDVVVMDAVMPGVDGFEATRRIMEASPVPIVIVSATLHREEVARTFRAVEAGAVAFLEKPRGPRADAEEARLFVASIKAMAEVRVVRRRVRRRETGPIAAVAPAPRPTPIRLVAVGASTGGPPALRALLAGLPPGFAPPLVVVQHIARGFLDGLVTWLGETSPLPVTVARHGERVAPGRVYFAPDDAHLAVRAGGRLALETAPPENGMRPAVSYLFRSVLESHGDQAAAVLLTGMGRDGAAEMALLRAAGAVTVAQDEESSAVHGMPGEAIRLGAAVHVHPPERIAGLLAGLVRS